MIMEIVKKMIPILAKKQTAEELGDRSTYIGASDISEACIAKIVSLKLKPVKHDLSTLIRFKRGHLAETILEECFKEYGKYKYITQQEVLHPQNPKLKCHIDFTFHDAKWSKIGVVECKSVSQIPDEPYSSWVSQMQFQMGLLKLNYPNSVIRGSAFAIDLNAGKIVEFNGYEPNETLFNQLLARANKIQALVECHETQNLPTSESMLCGFCPYKKDCPQFSGDEDVVPDDLKDAVRRYKEIQAKRKEMKVELNNIKKEILNFTGNDYHAKWDGNKMSVSIVNSRRLDSTLIESEHPDIYAKAVKVSGNLRLRIT